LTTLQFEPGIVFSGFLFGTVELLTMGSLGDVGGAGAATNGGGLSSNRQHKLSEALLTLTVFILSTSTGCLTATSFGFGVHVSELLLLLTFVELILVLLLLL
jgi:hypothetical protein